MKQKGNDDDAQEAIQRSHITFPQTVDFETAPEVGKLNPFDKFLSKSTRSEIYFLNHEGSF